MATWSSLGHEVEEITTAPGVVAAFLKLTLVSRKTGKTIETHLVEKFLFDGDDLVEIRLYYFDGPKVNWVCDHTPDFALES